MTSSIRDWLGLPEHILDLIVTKFGPLSDYYCFTAVCSKWRNLNPDCNTFLNILKLSCKKVPMLIITTEENNNESRGLYNVLNGITYNIQLPLPYNFRFIGSSHGWLICLDNNLFINLLNPFTNDCISLPIFKDVSLVLKEEWNEEENIDYYMKQAILSTDPHTNPNSYEVVVIYHGMSKLAYYKSGHECWSFIDLVPEKRYVFRDVIFYKSCIYSVTLCSELVQIDFRTGTAKTVVSETKKANRIYLVESQDGKLLLIKRFWDYLDKDDASGDFCKTFKFEVFKLVYSTENEFASWEEINNIGEQALFLGGSNHSLSVSTIECSKFNSNSIYYTPHDYTSNVWYECQGVHEDSGIFNLEDKSFHSHHVLDPSEKYIQPPVWFVPNFK